MEEGKEGRIGEEYRPEHLTYFGERKAEGSVGGASEWRKESREANMGDADADFNTSRG